MESLNSNKRVGAPGGVRLARAATAVLVSLGTGTALVHVPLAAAQTPPAPAAAPTDLSGLIRAVADASSRLDGARQDIAVKREGVNKTLVDLQVARVHLDDAIGAADGAKRDREKADGDLSRAQGTLQDYSRMLYRQGTAPGAASALVDPSKPAEAGQRQEYLQRASADQHDVVDRLQKTRADAGDRERSANDAVADADRKHTDAENRRDAAQADIARVGTEVHGLDDEVRDLTKKLDDAQRALAQNRAPQGPQAAAPAAPGEAPSAADQEMARQAQQRVASNPDADRKAQDVALALPSHLDLGAVRSLAAGSTDGARRAAGGVAGTVSPGSVQNAVAAGRKGDTDAIVKQVVDAVSKADMGSATQGPKQPGSATPTTKPDSNQGQTDDQTDDESDDDDTEEGTQPGTDTKDSGPDGKASGNAAKDIETVVDRAMAQLGKPYAWGGGDAKGPTKGIHDGGVADSYGDFDKVGFDCSGLMIYAFAGIGKALPHFTGYQYEAGKQVPVSERRRGDMLFWPGHVALYIGDGKMIEAPASGDVVKISPVRMAGIEPYAVRMVE